MRYPVVIIPFLNVQGMALYPFILLRRSEDRNDEIIIQHETIHLKQQQEMLVLPFYVAYLINYLYNLAIYRHHDKAYRQIIFEREAYAREREQGYLRRRKFWAFVRYTQ